MDERVELDISEFLNSLAALVYRDAETSQTVDLRDAQARSWCTVLPSRIELVSELDHHDCAAMLSDCVGIMHPGSARCLAETEPDRLAETLLELRTSNKLPLAARANHPATQLLTAILSTDDGRELYRSITVLLLEAQDDRDARRLLFCPPGRDREDRAPIQEVNDLDTLDADHGVDMPTTTEGTALVLIQLESDPKTVFEALLKRDPFTRLAIRENPSAALAALQQGEEKLGLSQPTAARALDEVVETFDDLMEARTTMDLNITVDRQAELLTAGGDLERSAAMIAGYDALYVALLGVLVSSTAFTVTMTASVSIDDLDDDDVDGEDGAEEEETEEDALQDLMASNLDRSGAVYGFARKLTENSCYEDLLEADLGGLTLRQILMLAVWGISDRPSNVEEVMASSLNEVGLDRDLCVDELKRLIASQRILELNLEDAARVRQEILMRNDGDDEKPDQASSAEPTLDLG